MPPTPEVLLLPVLELTYRYTPGSSSPAYLLEGRLAWLQCGYAVCPGVSKAPTLRRESGLRLTAHTLPASAGVRSAGGGAFDPCICASVIISS